MSGQSIPVDLLNPGQVFACLGLVEMTELLIGPCTSRFEYSGRETECRFRIEPYEDCIERAIYFLGRCKAVAMVPAHNANLSTKKWQVDTINSDARFFPGAIPDSPATLPVRLIFGDLEIPIEHWLDDSVGTGRDNVKFWAGAGGYPGAALARDAIGLLSPLDDDALREWATNPFAFSKGMDSSFRFDWRRDYIPLDAGFSPNDQPAVGMVGFPLVELLAAVGLQNARPSRVSRKNKLAYQYCVSNASLPTSLARAVLGCSMTAFPTRKFRMALGWPGKENQARCIIDAEEENT